LNNPWEELVDLKIDVKIRIHRPWHPDERIFTRQLSNEIRKMTGGLVVESLTRRESLYKISIYARDLESLTRMLFALNHYGVYKADLGSVSPGAIGF
jgi:hypothetical protein